MSPIDDSTPSATGGSGSSWPASLTSSTPPASRIARPHPSASSNSVRVFIRGRGYGPPVNGSREHRYDRRSVPSRSVASRRSTVRLTRARSLLMITLLIGSGVRIERRLRHDNRRRAPPDRGDRRPTSPGDADTGRPGGLAVPGAARRRRRDRHVDARRQAGRLVVLGAVLNDVQPGSPLGRGGSAALGGPGGVRGRRLDGL